MDQMTLEDVEIQERASRVSTLWADLDKRCKEVAYTIPRHRLAAILGLSYQYISEFLNTNGDQKPFKMNMLVAIAIEQPDKFIQVLELLCDLAGYDPPLKKRTLTADEELERVARVIRQHGLELVFREHGINF